MALGSEVSTLLSNIKVLIIIHFLYGHQVGTGRGGIISLLKTIYNSEPRTKENRDYLGQKSRQVKLGKIAVNLWRKIMYLQS